MQAAPAAVRKKNRVTVGRGDLAVNTAALICFVFCAVFSKVKALSYLSLTVYIIYFVYIVFRKGMFIVKYLAFVFAAVAPVVGTAIIELTPSFYLPELRCQAHFVGALPLQILSYWLLMVVIQFYEPRRSKRRVVFRIGMEKERFKRKLPLLTYISAGLIIAVFAYTAIMFPSAFLIRIDNFSYASRYTLPGPLAIIPNVSYLLLVCPLLSIVYGNLATRTVGIISIIVYLLYAVWTGSKFAPFFVLLCILLIVFYRRIEAFDPKKFRRIIFAVGVAMAGLVIIAGAIHIRRAGLGLSEFLFQRIAQQGQLWWRTYERTGGEIHPGEFSNEITAFFSGTKTIRESVGAKSGIVGIMYYCAPRAVIDAKLMTGAEYTQADFAVPYYYFGVPGVIIHAIVMGMIISTVMGRCIDALDRQDYICAFIYLRLFMVTRSVLGAYRFAEYLEPESLLSYLYLIVTWLLAKYGVRHTAVNREHYMQKGAGNTQWEDC